MDPAQTCELLLNSLKQSNLNFQLVESPFSVSIQIKKSFIREQNGAVRSSCLGLAPNLNKIKEEKETLEDEKRALEDIISNYKVSESTQNELEEENGMLLYQLKNVQIDFDNQKSDLVQFQIEQKLSEKKKGDLTKMLEEKKSEIILLKKSLKTQDEETSLLKSDLSKSNKTLKSKDREIFRLESKIENLSSNSKVFKAEVSKLKKDNNKLETALKKEVNKSKSSTKVPQPTDQLSSTLVPKFSPLYSLSTTSNTRDCPTSSNSQCSQISNNNFTLSVKPPSLPTSILSMANKISTSMSNSSSTIPLPSKSPKSPIDSSPASQENISYHTPLCSHSPHCVIRQPHPPPPDKCSVMQHSGSLYHEHMVSEMGVPSRYNTHEYCMRIEYQNYGCDNCIWFKWWGELHGYPDINPWSFREHLEPVTHL